MTLIKENKVRTEIPNRMMSATFAYQSMVEELWVY